MTQHLSRAQGHPGAASGPLTSRQKAAVIVRLLVAEGVPLPLSSLPEHLQAALTERLPAAPVTRDQLTQLALGDNVVVDNGAAEMFGVPLVPLDEQLRRAVS